ncbi:MAG: 50S ribosomal protein L3 [Opitutales bacterium]
MQLTLIGKKLGMTQVYDENNRLVPVTAVEVGPCPIVQVKSKEKEGYEAVQIGYIPQKQHRVSQPLQGHFKKAGVEPTRILKEFRTEGREDSFEAGGEPLTVARFSEGQMIDVIGQTKGRGFQGVVKRWGFAGGPASHGSMFHRRGGSYGQCQWPGEVWKGKKMPGHMGNTRRTVQNLQVVKIFEEKNILFIKGSVPGPREGILLIREAKKTKRSAA